MQPYDVPVHLRLHADDVERVMLRDGCSMMIAARRARREIIQRAVAAAVGLEDLKLIIVDLLERPLA